MHEKYRGQGVVFFGLTPEPEASNSNSRAFLQDTKITWANGYGATKTLEAFDTKCFPSAWVIGRDGKVTWNRDSRGSLESAIEAALNAKS